LSNYSCPPTEFFRAAASIREVRYGNSADVPAPGSKEMKKCLG
jgi:hypothetical protein